MEPFVYRKEKTKEISFPLGGIGTGCIGLAGNGRLIDWEIFNRPNKGSNNGFSHFAIKAESQGKVLDARVLNGDLAPGYMGPQGGPNFGCYGFGPHRTTLAGVPHFAEAEFRGEYPFAELRFLEEAFPGAVNMTAFNPLIPLNDRDSSIPGAFFAIEVENTSDHEITYTVACSLNNPLPVGSTVNTYQAAGAVKGIHLTSSSLQQDDLQYGDLCAATDAETVSYQEYWYRGSWFDNLGTFWRDFTRPGPLKNRSYDAPGGEVSGTNPGADVATLAAHVTLPAGAKGTVRFVITWNFPNAYNYWNPDTEDCCSTETCDCESQPTVWKNYYATQFSGSLDSARYALDSWERLNGETRLFHDALFGSTLPPVVLDAISANISILKTPTCLRLEDGSFYGWEGCHTDAGCCEGSCTHVWNYAYALPFLFPKLERSMRDLDFQYNQREDGCMTFRLQLPLGRDRTTMRPGLVFGHACADGQFGGVIKMYREWKISGDSEWLRGHWPAVRRCIEYAWAPTNEDKWDADKDGVLEGRQHHTLDMELYGPNSWLTGFYLAALKAGAEMAEFLGEADTAAEYRTLFAKGKAWVDEHLFNGEYYHQVVDLKDRSQLHRYKGTTIRGGTTDSLYWNSETEEIKYQVGEGCGIDQVLAQWHANLCGLGEIFDRDQTKTALRSLFRYNFKESFRDFFNPCRLYSLNDEAGMVICDWPEGTYKPAVPVPYAEETMYGFEYQAGIHMIQEGLVDEGLQVVAAIRERFDGEKRNPWNEFECGSNYARSMASYALLPTLSGFTFNMAEGRVGFDPIELQPGPFTAFWCLDCGWGTVKVTDDSVSLKVLYGQLPLERLQLPAALANRAVAGVTLAGDDVDYAAAAGTIKLVDVVLGAGQELSVTVSS